MSPRIAIRADATAKLGGGHIMRCLTLAQALRRRGAEVAIFVNEEALVTVPRLKTEGAVHVCGPGADAAVAAIGALWPRGADLAIVDLYAWSAVEERTLRRVAPSIAAIDDLANRPHEVDLLVDQTHGRTDGEYGPLAPAAQLMTGSRYALLRSQFASMREEALVRRRQGRIVERVFVSMGLTDLDGVTAKVTAALRAALPEVTLDVLLTSAATSLPMLKALKDPKIELHVDEFETAPLMARADLAVGAAGTTTWERCCVGLPSVVLVMADNQREIAANLVSAGAARKAEDVAGVAKEIAALASDDAARLAMAEAAAAVVDGRGADLVAAAIMELASPQKRARA
ncbi:UDP-2,4-diacetamido-2,4,6-trideoxy-beta-L-altropyranose hydrolase [Terricaulis sp.]|uniref:UDP-2,4-diacetamido-2,4, 6-trideoxy-beta-L-altropyranose hydrolase n=1 Tax=Terricaulis sp. TaxID=2768686 RepID=UPI0037850507